MKKILIGIIVTFFAIASFHSSAQSRWGAVAGVNLNSLHFNQELFSTGNAVGYSAGIMGDLTMGGIGFGVDAGILYTQRGGTLNLGEKKIWASQGYGEERSYLHYLEIPIHLRYMYSNLNGFEEKIAPFIYAGPSFSFLVAHSDIEALEYPTMSLTLQFGLGAQVLRKYYISACYDLGVSYTLRTKLLNDVSARNRGWRLSFTYFFGE